jgi:hypothetical protein
MDRCCSTGIDIGSMSELNDFLKLMAEGKKNDPVAVKAKEFESTIKESVKADLGSLFAELSSLKKKKAELIEENPQLIEEVKQEITEEVITEIAPSPTPIGKVPVDTQLPDIDKYLKPLSSIKPQAEPLTNEFKQVNDKIKFLERWIGQIQNAGPGSGEVNLRYLDDVKRDTIADGRWLKYSEADKKFIFDDINPYEVVYNTTEVTTPTYTVDDNDYYIGVNYAGPVTITLPSSANSGRMLIIKDEDGDAEINPITVLGTVDNDTGGFIIQINNGAIQMIYRNGWRIV